MRRTMMTGLALLALAVSATGVARPARAGIPYTLTDLGTFPGGTSSQAYSVNNSGQVAGIAGTAGGATHAFLSGPGGGPIQDLGTFGGAISEGFAVNDAGQVTGARASRAASWAVPRVPVGARRRGAEGPRHPRRGLQHRHAVNASGQVAGMSTTTGDGTNVPPFHAFLSGPGGGALKDLGTLGGDFSTGPAVNDSGQVTGYAATASNFIHAFLSGPGGGALKDLGTLGGTSSAG